MKLLYAEDERPLSEAVVDILTYHKYLVDAVYNGKDAYDYAVSGSYDGIILDIMMPGRDGIDVLAALRKKGCKTPILLLTAKTQIDDRIRGLDAGADDYIVKPFDLDELGARVAAHLRREQRRQGRMNDSLSALDSAKSQLDSMEKKLKVMNKCQKIAASIMRGDRVPPEDLAYLMNNDPEGYKLAMAMRRENPDPEDCESVLDEEDRAGASGEGYGGDAAPIEGASGGGEASAGGEPA